MAVVITSKFYQETEWKDISKVVFTSPNMDSPAIAGTRSHILPGQGALGLWYEDTSEMFRIEDHQWTTDSDFFNYRMKSKDEVDLQEELGYIDIKEVNDDEFSIYIKENTGVDIEDYDDVTGFINKRTARIEYTPLDRNLEEINTQSDGFINENISATSTYCLNGSIPIPKELVMSSVYRNPGWYTSIITGTENCYVTFEFAARQKIVAFEMKAITIDMTTYDYGTYTSQDQCSSIVGTPTTSSYKFFVGNYTVQGSNDEESWTTLYTGTNTTNTSTFKYITNTSYYTYYRINITANTSLDADTFNKAYYGIRALRFYSYRFSTEPGDDVISLYEFNDLDNPKILKISNAYPIASTTPEITTTNADTNITGSLLVTLSGGPDHSIYTVGLNKVGDVYDYAITAECISATVSGQGHDVTASIYTKSEKENIESEAWVDIINPGAVDEYFWFTAEGDTTVLVDTADWTGTADVTYTTVASGTLVSGTNYVPLEGYTTRTYESTLYSRRASYRLIIDEYTTISGIILENEDLYIWGYNDRPLDLDVQNSIVFEVTIGEAYNCRLTAWDDVTHSTTLNELIMGDHVRCSAIAYCCGSSKLSPGSTNSDDPVNLVYPPAHNRIFKGNVNYAGYKYYYGDFNMVYRYQTDVFGDYLIFKPMLYGIHTGISYGVHDYIITLHYSYT